MKSATKLRLILGLVSQILLHAKGQGFINLDFESARLPTLPQGQFGGYVSVDDAIPGWQVFFGSSNSPVNVMAHNGFNFGTINASIFGPNFSSAFGVSIIEGQFMPFLQAGPAGPPPASGTVTIAQTGLVPASAQSLQFKVANALPGTFGIFLNGQSLSLTPLLSTTNYTLWGTPVTEFAGEAAQLRFTVFGGRGGIDVGVDSFQFLSTAVPEPSTWALLALGSALLWRAARRRRMAR